MLVAPPAEVPSATARSSERGAGRRIGRDQNYKPGWKTTYSNSEIGERRSFHPEMILLDVAALVNGESGRGDTVGVGKS